MDILKKYPKPHPQTAGRVIDEEAVLMLSDSSEVNVLNAVGSRIFELSDGQHTTEEIAEEIVAEYDVDPEHAYQDLADFLRQMVSREILILSDKKEE